MSPFVGFTIKREHNSLKADSIIKSSAWLELHRTYVGSSKDQLLDVVDSDLKVLDVTSVFGPYAKYC